MKGQKFIISTPYDPNVSFTTTLYFTLLLKWMKSERCTKKKYSRVYRIARTIRVNKIKYEIYHVSVVR